MKSIKIFAVAGAIGLLGMAGLSSCKKNNNPEGPGNYNGETVKTEFSIAVPDLNGANHAPSVMRMPGKYTQRSVSEFQGITGITLVPFLHQRDIAGNDTRLGNNIALTPDLTPEEISSKNSKAKVYLDVKIPINTASFLFYGKSRGAGEIASATDEFEVGSLTANALTSDNPEDFSFTLKQIYTDSPTADGSHGESLLDYLSSVACTSDEAAAPATPKRWYEYTDGDNAAMKALFDTYITMHGLSSFEVERVLSDLYNTLEPISSSVPLAAKIMTAIANGSYATITGDEGARQVNLKAALDNFPQELSLPAGSIRIKWVGDPTYAFVECTSLEYTSGNQCVPSTYVFPAQLWYFVNSQIHTSNTSKKDLYTSTTNSWDDILNAHTDAIAVNSLTRAVAIDKKIQYAVSQLCVQVKLNSDVLVDNSDVVEGIAKDVNANVSGFPVTAVFVGGQKHVGWDFTPATYPSTSPEFTIYDSIMTPLVDDPAGTMNASTTFSAENATMVLETPASTNINIAVEMVNNTGKDFYGHGGQLIPKNGKFYVVAQLDASVATETDNKVFKQDYFTTARLTLRNLRHAYNEIPDLRTPQLELGFSVDLTWQTGHTYGIYFD